MLICNSLPAADSSSTERGEGREENVLGAAVLDGRHHDRKSERGRGVALRNARTTSLQKNSKLEK